MIALSLGWGVQSWALAAMSALGELPKLDVAVHSDTTHERRRTYEFAQEWTPWLESHGIPVATVTNKGYGGTDAVVRGNQIQIPAFTVLNGSKGTVRRQCTKSWKIRPLRQWLQANRNRQPVELWLGISFDEFTRAKDSGVQYIRHRFPLLEMRMNRQDCLNWLESKGLPSPGKSSCVFCPFLNKAAWQQMRAEGGDDWERAVKMDEAIREVRLPGELFLHSKRIPLVDAVVPQVASNQLELLGSDDMDAECDSGACFL